MERPAMSHFLRDVEGVRNNWGWFFLLGIILILLGAWVIGSAVTATLFSVLVFGFFLIGASVVQIVQGVMARQWSGIMLSILLAILYGIAGILCVANPAAAAVNITFLIAAFCFIGGLFKIVASLMMQFEQWGWVLFNGIVTFILGLLIYSEWPISGLWVIGLFVGVDMILAGWSWLWLSLAARKAGT